jgi:hypothetical protein
MRTVPLVIAAVLMIATSCARRPADPIRVGPGGAEALANPFAPASIRIHPLTRAESGRDGKPRIICHIEMHDAWGDTTKAIGQVQVQLYRPSVLPIGSAGTGEMELKWDTNLSDLKNNVLLWDPPTRTYRLPLEGAPAWVGGEEGRDKPKARLRAVLVTRGPEGGRRVLQSDFVLNE